MPKSIHKWGVEVNMQGDDGKPIYGPNGKLLKHKIKMHNANFEDGTPQSLYFELGLSTGLFKGMLVILQE